GRSSPPATHFAIRASDRSSPAGAAPIPAIGSRVLTVRAAAGFGEFVPGAPSRNDFPHSSFRAGQAAAGSAGPTVHDFGCARAKFETPEASLSTTPDMPPVPPPAQVPVCQGSLWPHPTPIRPFPFL